MAPDTDDETDRRDCRASGCTNPRDPSGDHLSWFCSTACEVRYDHLKANAKEARLDDKREAERGW